MVPSKLLPTFTVPTSINSDCLFSVRCRRRPSPPCCCCKDSHSLQDCLDSCGNDRCAFKLSYAMSARRQASLGNLKPYYLLLSGFVPKPPPSTSRKLNASPSQRRRRARQQPAQASARGLGVGPGAGPAAKGPNVDTSMLAQVLKP